MISPPPFPRSSQPFAPSDGVLDGELLVVRDGVVAPFNDLQQRLNRKTVTGKMLRDYPAHSPPLRSPVRWRRGYPCPALHRAAGAARSLVCQASARACPMSARSCRSSTSQRSMHCGAAARGRHRRPDAEAQGEPLSGRPAEGPLVQMEACGAHRRLRADVCPARLRQALVLLFGLHVRRLARSDGETASRELVPVGKAYSGFTDEELLASRPLDPQQHDGALRAGASRQAARSCSKSPSTPSIPRAGTNPGVAMRFPAHPPHPLGQAGRGSRHARNRAEARGARR